jgi:hypothetical protein
MSSINCHSETNLETLSCFEYTGLQSSLLEAAKQNIENIKVLILSDYLQVSLICIEKIYNLPPIINLFSDLRHNHAAFGKASKDERKVFELAKPRLEKLCSQDEQLWGDLLEKFQKQLTNCRVSKREIAVRKALHSNPVIEPSSYRQSVRQGHVQLIELFTTCLVNVAKNHSEISEDIVKTATGWSRFAPDAAKEIGERAMHQLRMI